MDNGEVFFGDGMLFPQFAKLAGSGGVFGDNDDAAGFAIETVNQAGSASRAEMEPRPANQAGPFIPFGGMTDQAGGFVDDQQVRVLENDLAEFLHCSIPVS